MVKKVHSDLEHLSSAHDGEGNEQDLLRLLDAIDSNPEQQREHALYHLIGDALRDPDSPTLSTDVTSRVMRSVAREPVPAVPVDASVHPGVKPFIRRQAAANPRNVWARTFSASAAAVAAVAFISAVLWKGTGLNADPVVAYVVFEQPMNQPTVVQLDSMPPDMIDYLLAHRQNSAAGIMSAGSAVIRASGDSTVAAVPNVTGRVPARAGDLEWARLWDNRPVYVPTRPVER